MHAAEVLREDPLRRSRGDRLRGQCRIWTADAVRQSRVVGDEQSFNPPSFRMAVENGVILAKPHSHRAVTVDYERRLVDTINLERTERA